MRIDLDPELRTEILRTEADARGLGGKLRSLAAAREADGLDPTDAEEDAIEALGLTAELDDALGDALFPLGSLEIIAVDVKHARAEMPLLLREEAFASMTLLPGSLAESMELARRLVALAEGSPDRHAFTLDVGLGGSGGCAQGCELPEDVPGPLFERRPA